MKILIQNGRLIDRLHDEARTRLWQRVHATHEAWLAART